MLPIVPVVDKFRCESIELTLFNVGECWPIVGEAGLFFQGWNPLPIAERDDYCLFCFLRSGETKKKLTYSSVG